MNSALNAMNSGAIARVLQCVQLWCGRESGCTHRLSHSGLFLMDFLIRSLILEYSYTFFLSHFHCSFTLLISILPNSGTQVEDYGIHKHIQDYSTCRSHKYIEHHASSRFLSHSSLLSQRTGFCFLLSFLFFNYFYIFKRIHLKIQDHDVLSQLQLVNIQVNRLIVWMVGPSVDIWRSSALVTGPSCVLPIELHNVGLLPESSPYAEVWR